MCNNNPFYNQVLISNPGPAPVGSSFYYSGINRARQLVRSWSKTFRTNLLPANSPEARRVARQARRAVPALLVQTPASRSPPRRHAHGQLSEVTVPPRRGGAQAARSPRTRRSARDPDPAQADGAIGAPNLAVDQQCRTGGLRLARADHHRGTAAIFFEGFDRQRHRYQPPVG